MKTYRKNAIWAGIFYIIATAAPMLTVAFIDFLGGAVSGETIPDYQEFHFFTLKTRQEAVKELFKNLDDYAPLISEGFLKRIRAGDKKYALKVLQAIQVPLAKRIGESPKINRLFVKDERVLTTGEVYTQLVVKNKLHPSAFEAFL